jgi:hypothetical protein
MVGHRQGRYRISALVRKLLLLSTHWRNVPRPLFPRLVHERTIQHVTSLRLRQLNLICNLVELVFKLHRPKAFFRIIRLIDIRFFVSLSNQRCESPQCSLVFLPRSRLSVRNLPVFACFLLRGWLVRKDLDSLNLGEPGRNVRQAEWFLPLDRYPGPPG